MKILQFDSVGGASGDMLLACLFNLGVKPTEVERGLSSLNLESFKIETSQHSEHGLHGLRVNIKLLPSTHRRSAKTASTHHQARSLKDIQKLIRKSQLPANVKKKSLKVFQRLGEAEANVHHIKVEDIHFHEISSLDSIIDIIGSCLAIELLGVKEIAVNYLPVGHGTIKCKHGTLPVPAPATVELLKGTSIVQTMESYELITPTGAALLTTLKTMDAPPPGSQIIQVGHGFGHWHLMQHPDLLRGILLKYTPEHMGTDECLVLECNLDDTNPELLGYLCEQLSNTGALDTFLTSVQMKKQRPGTLLTVLCRKEDRNTLLDMIFRESTTFGIREYPVIRSILQRSEEIIKTQYGNVRIKKGIWKGKVITQAPEYDDCVKLARHSHVSVRSVYEAAIKATGKRNARCK